VDILYIISHCSEAVKDIEMRMEMMNLMEFIIEQLFDQVEAYLPYIIEQILIPATAWKAQRPNNKIRKAAMVCLIKIFKNLNEKNQNKDTWQESFNFFKELLLLLKSTLEDDWDPELRWLSIQFLKNILILGDRLGSIDNEKMLEIYPHLLKRLDDSQDSNRIQTCEVLKIYFQICRKVKISESIFEYILNTAFVHLDDPNEQIRLAVQGVLKEASKLYPDFFIRISEKHIPSFTHSSLIKEMIEFAKVNDN
jgi:hypothetical protein